MHHYQWNAGDHARRTLGFTPMQDLAARRMLDLYFLEERPFTRTAEELAEDIGLPDQVPAVKAVLRRLYDWDDEAQAFRNRDADNAIADINLHAEQSRRGGITSGEVRRAQAAARRGDVGLRPTKIEPPLKHPLPTTHNPIPNTPPPPSPASAEPLQPPAPAPVAPAPAPAAPPPPPEKAQEGAKSGSGELFDTPAAPSPAPKGKKGAKATAPAAKKVILGYDCPAPDFLKDPTLWEAFIDFRRLKHSAFPFTMRAATEAVDNLLKCRIAGIDPDQRLKDTVSKGWRSPPAPNHYDHQAFAAEKARRRTGGDRAEEFFAHMTGEGHAAQRAERTNPADVTDVTPRTPRAK